MHQAMLHAPCWWCRAQPSAEPAGWTVARLDEEFTASWAMVHPFGGWAENRLTIQAGRYIACGPCSADVAAGRLSELLTRTGRPPGELPLLRKMHERLGVAEPLVPKGNE